ncbi:MAG: M20 metallopeptidase family protein [Eubacteriaceae bacterium]|jgi:amidohydrolase
MTENYYESLPAQIRTYYDEAVRIRRELHQIPESGFQEKETQQYILSYLRELGYEPQPLVDTGVSLFIPGNDGGERPARAIRGDMDGLGVCEPQRNEWTSAHEGMMHACGHDGHMTMVLLTIRYIKEHPEYIHGPSLFIFQPAEEGPGGAEPVSQSGIFDQYGIQSIYAYHLFPFLDEGVISTTPGPMMAMTSEFYITIHGKSSHAGDPEKGIDAIMAGVSFVQAIQTVLTRNIARDETTLINVGTFNGGERMNIVPGEVKISGTMRSYKTDVQEIMRSRMREILKGTDISFGTESDLNIVDMYPPVTNDESLFDAVWPLITGPKKKFRKVMLAEDFAMYQNHLPGLFIGLGCRNEEKGFIENLHTPGFDFDEKVLLRGVDLYLKILGS